MAPDRLVRLLRPALASRLLIASSCQYAECRSEVDVPEPRRTSHGQLTSCTNVLS